MTEEVCGGIPEDPVEAEDDFVKVAVSEALDGLHLPLGEAGAERDRVGKTLGVLGNGLLQHTCN